MLRIRDLKDIFLVCVDDLRPVVDGKTRKISSVIHVNMTMDKIGRPIPVQQGTERFKPSVGHIVAVVETVGGRVGQEDIESSVILQPPPELPYPPAHLGLGILMFPRLIPHGTSKPQYPDPFVYVDPVFDTDTPVGRRLLVAVVMISVHIQNRSVRKGSKKRQILRFQIPTGEDQVDPLQHAFVKIIPQCFRFLIGNGHDFHPLFPLFFRLSGSASRLRGLGPA